MRSELEATSLIARTRGEGLIIICAAIFESPREFIVTREHSNRLFVYTSDCFRFRRLSERANSRFGNFRHLSSARTICGDSLCDDRVPGVLFCFALLNETVVSSKLKSLFETVLKKLRNVSFNA